MAKKKKRRAKAKPNEYDAMVRVALIVARELRKLGVVAPRAKPQKGDWYDDWCARRQQ